MTCAAILRSAVIPKAYPLYKQCDPRWGSHLIVSETICEVGCLMSSTSMAIAGHNISINHALSTPDTLNTFLQQNGGYTSGNDMEESVVPQVNTKYISWPSSGMHRTFAQLHRLWSLAFHRRPSPRTMSFGPACVRPSLFTVQPRTTSPLPPSRACCVLVRVCSHAAPCTAHA
ncbi:hypothetical protein EON66_01230 [archaeon]|nr:MAG: hypothetical protein EON66_01230 [archaeon]